MTDGSNPLAETVRKRAIALYTFLKEFTELRMEIIRSLDSYEQVLWLHSVPKEPGCHCAAWYRGREEEDPDTWLEIKKPHLAPPPKPPADLEPWLLVEQWQDSETELPELRDEITVVGLDDEAPPTRLRLQDHPRIKPLWETYVQDRWWPWREQDRRAQAVQRIYTDLFRIYQKQQRLGEQFEVVLGIGLLKWKLSSGVIVERHLVAANTTIRFDASRGVIGVGPAADGAKPILEQDMLDPAVRPSPDRLQAIEAEVTDIGDAIWDPVRVDTALASWANSASSRGRYEPTLGPAPPADNDPQVMLAPALILRKRTDRSFLRAFMEVIRQLESGAPIPEGVLRFVSVVETAPVSGEGREAVLSSTAPAGETYFPLESNEDQRRIVERLASHQGVLVQGPPGTGKSHTIVNLICHLLAAGERVLVTSHTPRALRVLKRYIQERVPEIAPLAVLLLGEGSDALQAMEDSVQGITHKQNHWNAADAARAIAELEDSLAQAREEDASIRRELRSIRERETYRHTSMFGRYEGTLSQIAVRVKQEETTLGWMPDRVQEAQEPPLLDPELRELITLQRDGTLSELDIAGWFLPEPAQLPAPDVFATLSARETAARAAWKGLTAARSHPSYPPLSAAPGESRGRVAAALDGLLSGLDQVKRHMHAWAERAATEILGDRDRAWRDLHDTTQSHAAALSAKAKWVDETPVTWKQQHDHREARADAEELLAHLESGGHWGVGPFRAKAVKKALYLLEVRIGGRSCDNPKAIRDLIEWLKLEDRALLLRKRWAPYHRVLASSLAAQVAEFLDLCKPLGVALALHRQVGELRSLIGAIPGVPEPTWHDVESLKALRESIRAVEQEKALRAILAEQSRLRGSIETAVRHANAAPDVGVLAAAFDARDVAGYRTAFERLSTLHAKAAALQRRKSLLERLAKAAPALAIALAADATANVWDERARGFEAAWNWARARTWLLRLSDASAEEQLRLRFDQARASIRKRLAELASTKAWRHCFERMREHQRQHLVAWAKAVRAIGKGTGKYAPLHRRNAREHMNECRPAIPAWVMPLYRVAETIRPGSDLFDVVIVDEASQSGPEALLLAYMAKKVVVVGDDKQISPTHLGIDRADVQHIRERHLTDLPHHDSYGVDHSFFDLAEIRYPGRIRLREHFRCMPEIIQFSNKLCYEAEPLIPLRQYGAARLAPVVGTRHVPDGYLKGSGHSVANPPEAQAVAAWIETALADPVYKGKSFGVISLLGEPQAKEIERLLLERVGPEQMEKRQLVCGDAYAFQGDERDVIVLSMVSAVDAERRIGTLTSEPDRRRFNVAASRARDQMLLFHSVTTNDLSPKCYRFKLLEYCLNPTVTPSGIAGLSLADIQRLAQVADRAIVRPPEPFESWFEVDVFLRIAARGYRVLPQYEVGGYRIDLVVEGMVGHIAVECDGDHWHGPERYEQDAARQRDLERCGRVFYRIRGSAFSVDPEGALDGLWNTLDRHGVLPGAAQPANAPTTPPHVPEDDDSREAPSESARPGASQAEPPGESDERAGASTANTPGGRLRSEHRYEEWRAVSLPDPAAAATSDVVMGLVSIVEHEGPMTVHRACRLFIKASGGQRVGKNDRSYLHRAMRRAAQQGLVSLRNETDVRDLDEHIARKAGSSLIRLRCRGPRDFSEIPPSEIAAVLRELACRHPDLVGASLYREVLVFYETRRMTSNIEDRLRWIEEKRASLLTEFAPTGPPVAAPDE